MTDQLTTQQTEQWTQRPGRAITYGPFARLGDWWWATRDARTFLPAPLAPAGDQPGPPRPSGPASLATPRSVFLGQLGRGRAEKEWLRYQKEVADFLIPLAAARSDRDSALLRLRDAREDLRRMTPPEGAELKARKAGEQETDDTVVQARRMLDFTRRRQAAEAGIQQLRAQVAGHEAGVARLSEPVRIRFEVAKTRAELIDAYVRRRRAHYFGRLVRKHSGPARVEWLIQDDWPERPPWATSDISPDLVRPSARDDQDGAAPSGGPMPTEDR